MAINRQYDDFVRELQQCKAGRRGWVDCSISRARKMGLAHANLTVAARALGLTVVRHGNHGWTAAATSWSAVEGGAMVGCEWDGAK